MDLKFDIRSDFSAGESYTIIDFDRSFHELWGSTIYQDRKSIGNYGRIKVKATDGSGEIVITFVDFENGGKKLNSMSKTEELDGYIHDTSGTIRIPSNIKFNVEVSILKTETLEYETKSFSGLGGEEDPIDESLFSPTIRNDELDYELVFNESIRDLIYENSGYGFYINFLTLGNNKKLTAHSGIVGNSISIPSSWNLQEYGGQTISAQIVSNETSLNKQVSLVVPKAIEETDITAQITGVGTVAFKNNGNAITGNELLLALSSSLSTDVHLYYQGASNPTATSGIGANSAQVQYSDFLEL